MKLFPGVLLCFLFLAAAGCRPERQVEPATGEAYVAPATLSIRQDIALQSPVVATVAHGERLEILQRRRRFVKVRTPQRAEGWTDERLLLSPEEIASLQRLSGETKSAPSHGKATTYETLNIHTLPDRQSPSFLQVKEGEQVDVIGRRVAPRVGPPPPRPARPAPKERARKQSKESKKSKEVPPPPPPSPPLLPADWLQLSHASNSPAPEPKPVPLDDWSLIRNASGESGWALTRRLVMAIPDEVAQYAEGRRITSYFALGETRDGAAVKKSWLWTTVEHGLTPYDFDSFRVFVWSLRRHRYETAHIERNLTGYFPVLVEAVAAPKPRGAKDAGAGKVPGFSLIVQKKDGLRYRRSFAFLGNTVRFSSEVTAPADPAVPDSGSIAVASPAPQNSPQAQQSLYARLKKQIGDWGSRLFGR